MIGKTDPGGHMVRMLTSNPLHFGNDVKKETPGDDISSSFADMLKNAVGKVNNLQVDSERLTRQMIYEPESVDIHTVMISAQKAELALDFTRAVRDGAVRAYRELMNLR